jgi:uncharacterized protein (DUF2267 family)
MALNFDQYSAKGKEFLKKASVTMQVEYDENVAGRIVRAVFHALRDQLSPEENLQLLAQLPTVLKGVYVEGWKFSPKHRIHHAGDFFNEVRKRLGATAAHDLGNDQMARRRIGGVFEAMAHYVSEGELADVSSQLPNDLKSLILKATTESLT